jgi:hypothetical protein
MTGTYRSPPLRRPRPGAEKLAADAWCLADRPDVAMRLLDAAGIRPREQAEFLRAVIGLPEAQIPDYLAIR